MVSLHEMEGNAVLGGGVIDSRKSGFQFASCQ
jgi:hypothetical protein